MLSCNIDHFIIYDENENSYDHLTQWDANQSLWIDTAELSVSSAPLFHFCNQCSTEALVVASTVSGGFIKVKIPNKILQEPHNVIAYVYEYEDADTAKTVATIRIPLIKRVKPSDYTYVENVDKITAEKIEQMVLDEISTLERNYAQTVSDLNDDFAEAIATLLANIHDGSPKGIFQNASELTGKEAGVYLNTVNGYVYYWDGTTLSDAIIQYMSDGIANGYIVEAMLSAALQKEVLDKSFYFATMSDATSYLNSAYAKVGQIIRVKEGWDSDNEEDIVNVYVIVSDGVNTGKLKLISITAKSNASEVACDLENDTIAPIAENVAQALDKLFAAQTALNNTITTLQTTITNNYNTLNGNIGTNSTAITTLQNTITSIQNALRDDYATDLDFDSVNSRIALLNSLGVQLGDAVSIMSEGISDISVDTIQDEDENGNLVYYLVIYDADGSELTRCLLPATGGGGGGSAYLVRLLNQMGSLRYSVASTEEHRIGLLYMETLGGESTNVEGSITMSYKLANADTYVDIGIYNIPCAASVSDVSKIMYFDVTDYLTPDAATNIKFVVTGGESGQTKTVIYTITSVEIGISTTTDFNRVYNSNVSVLYKCVGRGLSKTVYFYVDGVLYNTVSVGTSHNQQLSQTIDLLNDFEYGSHELMMYFVTSDGARSNTIKYAILYDDGTSTDPIIGVANANDTILYGETISVNYSVYTPGQETTDELGIELYTMENGNKRVYASSQLSNVQNEINHIWTCNNYPASGTVYVTFTSGNTTKTIELTIAENGSDYNIYPVTTNLVYMFDPSGKSNNDVGKENYNYEYTDVNNVTTNIVTEFTNMNWVSDGYVATSDGDALRLSADDKMIINVPILSSSYIDSDNKTIRFNNAPTVIGRTIEITLNMHEVTDNTVDVVTCMSNSHAGFKITPQYAVLLSATSANIDTDNTGFIENEESICAAYIKDEKKLRISFVIAAVDAVNNRQCLYIYINGEVANSIPYDVNDNFIQSLPITIGNAACITDIYDIKIYDRELSESEIKMNYYASLDTIAKRNAIYEANDVLNDREEISYEKCLSKYPCLLCVGELSPYKGAKRSVGWVLTKPDGNGGYVTEFDCTEKLDGKFLGTINVQGTSSQKFIRKNYKVQPAYIKNGEKAKYKYVIKEGGIGESTLCWKADYMSSDHANTFNANLADKILTEISPSTAQIANSKVQNTVNGFRCLFFNQATEGGNIVFTGDGCLNNDKGNNKAYGLENDGDLPTNENDEIISNYTKAQKIEFTNNTADLCHFKTDNFRHKTDNEEDVYTAFESCYPDQGDLEDAGLTPNWDYWQVAVTFLAQRANFWDADATTIVNKSYNGQTYSTERAYRKAIFQNEFVRHFDLNRSLIYYLFLEFTALVDNRAKNMFMTCFDTTVEQLKDVNGNNISINDCIDANGNVDADRIDWLRSTFCIWQPTLYDLDSCYSAENNGYLRVPYFANWDYELNGTKQFNGYESRLWLPFEEVYTENGQIQAMAQRLASAELMTYDNFKAEHITNNTEKMCATIVNKDMVFKYESPWIDGYYDYSQSTTNPPFVQTNMYKYLHRGQRIHQKDSYIYNRSHIWYSKYQTTQFIQNNINFRVGASNGVSAANANITLTANLALYLAARYGDGSQYAVTNGKINPNTPTTLHASNGVGHSDTIYLYSGTDLTDIGDISIFEPYEIQLRNAKKMKILTIGSSNVTNTSLSSLDTSAMSLLQKLNIRKCTALNGVLDLTNNGLIEEVYASGSGCTGISLPVGGNLTKLELPAVRTLSILNHTHLNTFSCDSYANLIQLRVENTPTIPTATILQQCVTQLTSGIRLVGVNWTLDNSSLLELLVNDAMKGKYITASGTLSEDATAYPYISGIVTITRVNQSLLGKLNEIYPDLQINYSILTHTVKFYSDANTLFNVQEIDDGFPANTPSGIPTKPNTPQYVYEFVNYDTSYTRVIRDMEIYANYTRVLQKYNVAFYTSSASSTALYTVSNVEYGQTVVYNGDNPSTSTMLATGWKDKGNTVYSTNTVELNATSCYLDSSGNPATAVFYTNYEPIQMPTQSVAALSLMTFAELKAVANMIKAGGDSTWNVRYNQSDLQYVLTNETTGVTVTLTVGDEIDILCADGITTTWQIYDFLHDIDANGDNTGITLGMKNCHGASGRVMNPSFKHCFDYTLAGTRYQNDNGNYSNADDTTDATIHTVTDAEARQGYITLTVNDRTFLRNIVVTDSGGTQTRWWFDYRGYYSGNDVESVSSPSWYLSDFTQNTYKLGKLVFNNTNSNADKSELSGISTSSGFGGMTINTTNGKIIQYIDTANWNNFAVYSEIYAGTVIQIPVASGDTVQINHWSYSRNVGGYERTAMREWVNNVFTPNMPLGWTNIITPVQKKTNIGNRNTTMSTVIDKIWLFSGKEVGTVGATDANYGDEGRLYPIFTDNNSRIKKYSNGAGDAANWWLRSPNMGISYGSGTFLGVITSGGYNSHAASYSYGVVLGFAI